jgi:hypothetical protein
VRIVARISHYSTTTAWRPTWSSSWGRSKQRRWAACVQVMRVPLVDDDDGEGDGVPDDDNVPDGDDAPDDDGDDDG